MMPKGYLFYGLIGHIEGILIFPPNVFYGWGKNTGLVFFDRPICKGWESIGRILDLKGSHLC